jgi:hypothetical protein
MSSWGRKFSAEWLSTFLSVPDLVSCPINNVAFAGGPF